MVYGTWIQLGSTPSLSDWDAAAVNLSGETCAHTSLLVKLGKKRKNNKKNLVANTTIVTRSNTIYQKSSITMVTCCHGIQTWQSLPWQLGGSPWLRMAISSSMEEMETLSRWMRASVACTCLFRSALGSALHSSIFDQSDGIQGSSL